MSSFTITDAADQVRKYWSDLFMKELREKTLLAGLVNKDYQGEIKKGGDTVRVTQINAPTGERRTVGTDAESFNTEALSESKIDIVADQRIVAAYEFEDLVDLMSQIKEENSEIREGLRFAVEAQLNDYLYSLASPSTSAPDHELGSVADMNKAQIIAIRKLAAVAKWGTSKPWYLLCDPSYYSDILSDTTLTSQDFSNDKPLIQGQSALQRLGFNIMEDNSRGTDYALAFHPDFMHLVMQTTPQFKISDLHSQKKFGYIISVDFICGAKLGINGNVKHIRVQA